MFHFHFDLEDGVDETLVPQDLYQVNDAASTPQQTGEPFSEIDLDSLVGMVYPLHPDMHPSLSSIKSSWRHYLPKYPTPSSLLRPPTITHPT